MKDLCSTHVDELLADARKPRPGRRKGVVSTPATQPKKRGRPRKNAVAFRRAERWTGGPAGAADTCPCRPVRSSRPPTAAATPTAPRSERRPGRTDPGSRSFSARSWITVQCSGPAASPQHGDDGLGRVHDYRPVRARRDHALGEQLEHRRLRDREGQDPRRHDDLFDPERLERLDAFEHLRRACPRACRRATTPQVSASIAPPGIAARPRSNAARHDDLVLRRGRSRARPTAGTSRDRVPRPRTPRARRAPDPRRTLGRPPPDGVPPVGVPGRQAQQPRTALPADPHRDARALHRGRQEAGIAQRHARPVDRGGPPGRTAIQHRDQGLFQLREPFPHGPERVAEGIEFLLEPAGTDPEVEPAAGEQVDRRRHLRQDRRVAERRRTAPACPGGLASVTAASPARAVIGSSAAIGVGARRRSARTSRRSGRRPRRNRTRAPRARRAQVGHRTRT